MKKATAPARPRPGFVALEIGDDDALRRLIDGWPSYPREPQEKPLLKLTWDHVSRPGIKLLAEVAKEKIAAKLLPKDPRKNKKHKKKP